jgi:hypothetical protein
MSDLRRKASEERARISKLSDAELDKALIETAGPWIKQLTKIQTIKRIEKEKGGPVSASPSDEEIKHMLRFCNRIVEKKGMTSAERRQFLAAFDSAMRKMGA